MTNGSPAQSESSPRETRLSRRVSSLKIRRPDLSGSDSTSSEGEPSPKATHERRPRPANPYLMRQVSHDGLNSFSEKENDKKRPASDSGRTSPVRCVSEFDKVMAIAFKSKCDHDADLPIKTAPHLPNPLHNCGLFAQHSLSLRLEADLHPMRLILSRLMVNLTYNRKGIFNSPVDPVALGLIDYFDVIKKPMDLGTVKNRLHSVAYHSRREVAEDIRLCLRNAMTYNPPHNIVHISAKELLACFEDQVASFCPELAESEKSSAIKTTPTSHSEVVTVEQPPLTNNLDSLISNSEHGAEFKHPPEGDLTFAAAITPTNVSSEAPSSVARLAVASAHTLSTRKSSLDEPLLAPSVVTMTARKRKKRGSKSKSGHNCQMCHGNVCAVCNQGCLPLEPTLLICNGPHCVGAKVRKGATYFIAPDGSCQYCQRCYAGLPAVLPQSGKYEDAEVFRYKRDLLKRKNDEEAIENWITCAQCQSAVHQMCAMHNPYVHEEESFHCPSCVDSEDVVPISPRVLCGGEKCAEMYTFLAGSNLPVPMSDVASGTFRMGKDVLSAEALSETAVSAFIEEKVRQRMISDDCPHAEKTVTVRIISECERFFNVPDVIRKHFHIRGNGEREASIIPPSKVMYRSKAIALFQKIDGLDVCIFCMYVQEYDGKDDEFENPSDKANSSLQKRVYIAYLDSVEHFRPRTRRTQVYQEVLTAYLASARKRGYEAAHIWACPPSRGNSFVFWNHPAAQRTPNMERLTAWYHAALSRAMECGVVTDVKSLYESDFEESMRQIEGTESSDAAPILKMACPPLLEGDFWIEEAVRVHSITLARHSKEKSVPVENSTLSTTADELHDACPAIQIGAMLRDKIITHPSAVAFRRPVNAAAMKLKDYHRIISKPMDLGTVHSRCVLGEYRTLSELASDVELVFSNAKKFNPPGHVVHTTAIELGEIFAAEIDRTTKAWLEPSTSEDSKHSWELFKDMSMSLAASLKHFDGLALVESPSDIENAEALVTSSAGSGLSLCSDEKSSTCDGSAKTTSSVTSCTVALPTVDLMNGQGLIHQRMVGSDVWLLDKKNPLPPKGSGVPKKAKRGRKSSVDSIDEPVPKRRRQTWLGEEVATAVRRMRTSFFMCSLGSEPSTESIQEEALKVDLFNEYAEVFREDGDSTLRSSRVADARHALLEFSQFRSLEFDTLRRAKYSSAMLLYHLHNESAPGLIPDCTSCHQEIEGVRWHRINKVIERHHDVALSASGRKPKAASSIPFKSEELCSQCHSKYADQDQFIPLQVSL